MANAAVLLAGGNSTRMSGSTDDKLLLPLAGKPVIAYSIESFLQSGVASEIVIVYRDETQRKAIAQCIASIAGSEQLFWAPGGPERQESVFHGLSQISLANDYVFIHDCARPLIRPETLRELALRVQTDKAITLAHPINDTVKRVTCPNKQMRHCQLENIDRDHLWAMETPQVFELETILECYRRLRYDNLRVTDDTAALSHEGKVVSILETGYPNFKLTCPADIPLIEALLHQRSAS